MVVGDTQTATIVVQNDGSSDLTIGNTLIDGVHARDYDIVADGCSSAVLAPTEQCSVEVAFQPSAPGQRTANLRVESDDADEPWATTVLEGTGIAPNLVQSPVSLHDFGSVVVGTTFSDLIITISNDGNAPLVLGSISLTGANPSHFVIVSDGCSGQTLLEPPVTATCAIELGFSPSTVGVQDASIDIPSNDPDTPNQRSALTGTGVAAPNAAPSVPQLLFPDDRASDLATSIELVWNGSDDADGDALTYRVFVCIDAAFAGCAGRLAAIAQATAAQLAAGSGVAFVLLTAIPRRQRRQRAARRARSKVVLLLVGVMVVLFACTLPGTPEPEVSIWDMRETVPGAMALTVTNLERATTYYWKVEVDDGNGGKAVSSIRRFATR